MFSHSSGSCIDHHANGTDAALASLSPGQTCLGGLYLTFQADENMLLALASLPLHKHFARTMLDNSSGLILLNWPCETHEHLTTLTANTAHLYADATGMNLYSIRAYRLKDRAGPPDDDQHSALGIQSDWAIFVGDAAAECRALLDADDRRRALPSARHPLPAILCNLDSGLPDVERARQTRYRLAGIREYWQITGYDAPGPSCRFIDLQHPLGPVPVDTSAVFNALTPDLFAAAVVAVDGAAMDGRQRVIRKIMDSSIPRCATHHPPALTPPTDQPPNRITAE